MSRVGKPVLLLAFAVVAIACIPPETEQSQVATETEAAAVAAVPDATAVDPDHYKVEFENERVRIVRIKYGPGEESVMHHHPDHVAVMLTALQGEFRLPDGTTQPVDVKAGDHLFVPAGAHHPKNTGGQPFEAVSIELKPASPGAAPAAGGEAPDATTADPGHYKTEFENERLRVVRFTYGPGEESALHHHPDHVAVMLTAADAEFTMPDGTTQEMHVKAGEHVLAPAGTHSVRNLGAAMNGVLVELK